MHGTLGLASLFRRHVHPSVSYTVSLESDMESVSVVIVQKKEDAPFSPNIITTRAKYLWIC